MKSNEVADESYSINGFKHFSDLAVAYFPQMASTSSASKKMRNCIKASNALSEQLADAHYTDTTIEISPLAAQSRAHRSKLHRTHDFAKSEDAANHLGVLGTTHHFTVGKPGKRVGQQTSLNAQKSENRTIYF